ncbi:MAG: cytochrome c biogenesis protein CcsA [Saprospiraceae bacterium]
MGEIQYNGEHVWLGIIGHIAIIIAFVSAILAAFSYFNHIRTKDVAWQKLGRLSFNIHGASIFTVIGLIAYVMYHHMYEFAYVFDHVSDDLPLKYILSAFWEGQEGSFLLWMFWHIVLGVLLIAYSKDYEAPVILVIALAEVILTTMILGIYIPLGTEGLKVGSNPMALLRHMNEAPIFQNADYLSLIKGRGLNPLLQNYWMTIHPPITFLGFASTIVPYAFALGGLIKNDQKIWLEKSYPWVLFSAGMLGTGILMGSLWAYEALTFGGYWAWDPVENASLVAWLTLVAGLHIHLIIRHNHQTGKSIYFYYIITFVLVLYSTYLTRSGVLGDTSAHAFTNMGLDIQLIFLVGFFLIFGLYWWIKRWHNFPVKSEDEALYSREFWISIGSLVLLFSAFLIIVSTSLPVINKVITIFDSSYNGRVINDPIQHYNKYQIWVAIIVSILSAAAIHLRYLGINWSMMQKKYWTSIAMYVVISIGFTFLVSTWLDYFHWTYTLLTFSGVFTVVSNGHYLINRVRQSSKVVFSALSHMGFGLMIIGIIGSALNQKFISSNPFIFSEVFNETDVQKYVQLIKGKPLFSQNHLLTYVSDTLIGRERIYTLDFKEMDANMQVKHQFQLHPNAVYANDMSKIAAYNPDTKHTISKDIFTAVVAVPPSIESVEKSKEIESNLKYQTYEMTIGDTLRINDTYSIVPLQIISNPKNSEFSQHSHDAGFGIDMAIVDTKHDTVYFVQPAMGIDGALLYQYPAVINDFGIILKLNEEKSSLLFSPESSLNYTEYNIKVGEHITVNGITMSFKGVNSNPQHKNYKRENGDIALSAIVELNDGQKSVFVEPVFIVRNKQIHSLKDFSPEFGTHVRFSNIDPNKEIFTFKVAIQSVNQDKVYFDLAKDVPRNDYIIVMASVFPGINLFWLGTILMMMGLFLASGKKFLKIKNL